MNRLRRHRPIPIHLVITFFRTFARIENALKGAGYARGNPRAVEANWSAFAKKTNWHFVRVKDRRFRGAVRYLLAEPPRKQVLRDDRVIMLDSPPDPRMNKTERVLLMVRRVRNNLYHGEK